MDTSTKQLMEHCERGNKKTEEKKKQKEKKEQRAKEFAVKLCLLELSEDTSIKSDQHDCLKMT